MDQNKIGDPMQNITRISKTTTPITADPNMEQSPIKTLKINDKISSVSDSIDLTEAQKLIQKK